MKKNNLRVVRDRNMKYKPWEKLIPYAVTDEMDKADGIVQFFQNHIVTVAMKQTMTDGFSHQKLREDGTVAVFQLMCRWTDPNRSGKVDVETAMRVKDEICEPGCEAVIHLPADYRTVKSKFTDVWVFEKGLILPFGRLPSDLEDRMRDSFGEGNILTKEDVQVYVVRHMNTQDELYMTEVFASEQECKLLYDGSEIPESAIRGVEMLGSVPAEASDVVWTQAAKVKIARVLAVARATENAAPSVKDPSFYDDNIGQEEIDLGIDKMDDAPFGDEEKIVMAKAMADGIEAKANARVEALRRSVANVIDTAKRDVEDALEKAEKVK